INAILLRGCIDLFFIFCGTLSVGLQTGAMRMETGETQPLKLRGMRAILRLAMQNNWSHPVLRTQWSLTHHSR
ncbi:MAG: hypothetical protein KAS40_03185, partial [Desulfobacterales bacterium]|nr:hypothetical protein [Desulfobacterales bacterium]